MRPIVAPTVCALLFWCGACGPASDPASEESLDPATPARAQTTAVSAGDVRASVFQEEADKPTPKIDAARAEVAANPDDPEAHRRLGLELQAEMLRNEALPHFLKALELDPGNARYKLDLASSYTSLARFDEAEVIYNGLLEVPRYRHSVLHNLGNIALRKDDLETALDYYEKALVARPDYLLAHYHYGVALQQAGRYEESYNQFKAVLALPMPEEPKEGAVYYDAVYRLGGLDLSRGNSQRAVEIFELLLKNYPDHPNAWYGLGRAYMLLGRAEEAREAFGKHVILPDRRYGRLGYLGSPWLADRPPPTGGTRLWFEEVTEEAGIDYVNVSGEAPPGKNWISETLGSGAAWLDYDGDGVLDVFIANGSQYDRPKDGGEPNRLFRGNGSGGFDDVTAESGIGHGGWGVGAGAADFDNDGDTDIYVANLGPNALYRNNGDGTFTDITESAGVGDPKFGTSLAFFDLENDGDLDIYIANYMDLDPEIVPKPGESTLCGFKGIPTLCGPKPIPTEQDVLYRNNGDSTFTEVSRESGVWVPEPLYTLGVVTGDHDNDGDQDLYVANDSVRNLLWENQGDGTLVDIGVITMAAVGAEGRAQSGMGTDIGDYNNDGWMDIVVTNFSHDVNTVYRNVEGKYYVDESAPIGMSVTNKQLSWGTGFHDFDNDGLLDLFIANGHIYPEMDDYDFGTTYAQVNHIFLNEEGTRFVELSEHAGPGFEVKRSSRGAAFADYDDDGDVDILVTEIDDRATLLRNDSPSAGHFLKVALVGTRSNRDGIGARVTVTAGGQTRIRERKGGGSFLCSQDPRLHFGLGEATVAERVEVRWPSGERDVLTDVPVDRLVTIVEGEASGGS